MQRLARVVAIVALLAPIAACQMPTGTNAERVAAGTWGGDHMRLDVTSSGATIEYDCAHGAIDEPIVPDSSGRFSVGGTHTFEHGGPVRPDETPNRHPARYDGRVVGDTMDIAVTVTDSGQRIGQFMVFFRHSPRLLKCL
jgi:hypothetical protein